MAVLKFRFGFKILPFLIFGLDIYGESIEFASNGLLWLSGVFLLSEQLMGSVDQRKSRLLAL